MRRLVLFLALLALLVMGFSETAYACTRPDCLPPGAVRTGGPSGSGR
ncbi:hypothetical protein Mlute_01947 [Meiothermus luteus]|jgi:hypothetical protein|uniref:Uncharacterized protein n=1 Tax=Meiothermus luteus TaxID=2026184 RepID=A0A399EHW2_9DEIN|nr:hypothetical protein [Meiothermus luteus]RIH84254.1 hypothetical protein Mlute_01937 [Meiothermus luteus]RIH84264.1 hypothetical protein Mlute_01947 [Meiothermus luteus]